MDGHQLGEILHDCLACGSPQELLNTARRAVRSPLILADLTLHVLAITEEEGISDPRWLQISAQRMIPLDVLNLNYFQRSNQEHQPVRSVDATGLTILRAAVEDRGKLIGYLMSPCYGGEPEEGEIDVLRILADLCCLRMEKQLSYVEYPDNLLHFFLADLMQGVMTDEEQIQDQCRRLHWNQKMPYQLLSIRPVKEAERRSFLLLRRRAEELQTRFPEATVFQYGDRVKMLVHIYNQTARDELMQSELTEELAQLGLVAGVSQAAYRLVSMARRNTQAEKALELGEQLHSRETLLFYKKYSIYHCLEICAKELNLLQCCHPAVTLLERYDRENGTELLETLHAYLISNQGAAKAAADLHIHRNTLTKRLEKIYDLCVIDLEDSETVFHLQYSYHILEYYGSTFLNNSYESWIRRSPTLRHP
ncbi:MAG: helix-turn-helix domain-containing protein [Oscillospiraceae bacterium]|nr:helix-turn-helix domain-containing protein [Oscillospiraceae bacterium]